MQHIQIITAVQGMQITEGLSCAEEAQHCLCSIFLVFEYCTHDLGRLVDAMPRPFSPSEVKCLMLQVSPDVHEHLLQAEAAGWATRFYI